MIFNIKDFHCRVWDKRMKHRISREKAQKAQKIQCKMCELSSANTPPMQPPTNGSSFVAIMPATLLALISSFAYFAHFRG